MTGEESVAESWGYRCPECGSDEHIEIWAEIKIKLLPNNESDIDDTRDGSWDWDGSSIADCKCGFTGRLRDFAVEEGD